MRSDKIHATYRINFLCYLKFYFVYSRHSAKRGRGIFSTPDKRGKMSCLSAYLLYAILKLSFINFIKAFEAREADEA